MTIIVPHVGGLVLRHLTSLSVTGLCAQRRQSEVTRIGVHRVFDVVKRFLPRQAVDFVRSFMTALLTPILFSVRTGHFRSSWKRLAVSRTGAPLPWYSYPAIHFLSTRSYEDRTVLEFGGGQSTLWWAKRARHVVTVEGDREWCEWLRRRVPPNVDLLLVSMEDPEACVRDVTRVLADYPPFDLVIVDGLYRLELSEVARRLITDDGAVICDDSQGYHLYESFLDSGMNRVDFFGNAPGVVLPRSTSVFFNERCFLLSSTHPIPVIPTTQ